MRIPKGFTFLEILFSLFLMSLLLLGVDAVLFTSLRQVKTNLYFASAIEQLGVITERMKIMPRTALTNEIARWNQQNKRVLPQAEGWLQKNKEGEAMVIAWGGYKEKICQKNKIGESGCLKTFLPPG